MHENLVWLKNSVDREYMIGAEKETGIIQIRVNICTPIVTYCLKK
jgi:hypothetical protein